MTLTRESLWIRLGEPVLRLALASGAAFVPGIPMFPANPLSSLTRYLVFVYRLTLIDGEGYDIRVLTQFLLYAAA
jgi:hypothetical protein